MMLRTSSFFTMCCDNKAEPSRASFFRKEHVCHRLHCPILPVAGESPFPKEQSLPKHARTLTKEFKETPTSLLMEFLRDRSKARSTASQGRLGPSVSPGPTTPIVETAWP